MTSVGSSAQTTFYPCKAMTPCTSCCMRAKRAQPTRRGGYETMRTLLDQRPRPTAAVCYNDVIAFGALSALGEKGMRAGKDFALLGFDNVQDAAHSNPPLSTLRISAGSHGL